MESLASCKPKYLARTRGEWDVLLVFPFRHGIEAAQRWRSFTARFPFSGADFSLCGRVLQPERLPFLPKGEPEFKHTVRRELSKEDVRLLEDLADFPTDSIVARVKRLKGSGEAWRQRLAKLRADGILRGPCAWPDVRRLGYFRVHYLAAIRPYTHELEVRLSELLKDIPEVSYAEALTGAYSLRFSLLVKNPDELFGCLARLDGFFRERCTARALLWEEYEALRRSVPTFG
jgi:DNA-binding Lrp family transcriptional regulator